MQLFPEIFNPAVLTLASQSKSEWRRNSKKLTLVPEAKCPWPEQQAGDRDRSLWWQRHITHWTTRPSPEMTGFLSDLVSTWWLGGVFTPVTFLYSTSVSKKTKTVSQLRQQGSYSLKASQKWSVHHFAVLQMFALHTACHPSLSYFYQYVNVS